MSILESQPFAGLKTGKDKGQTFFKFDASHKPKPRPKQYRAKAKKPRFAFVLQAFDGERWKVVRKDGLLIHSKSCSEVRTKEFVKCLQDVKFVAQMKIQIFGRGKVTDKTFFATPVRWKSIDAVQLT